MFPNPPADISGPCIFATCENGYPTNREISTGGGSGRVEDLGGGGAAKRLQTTSGRIGDQRGVGVVACS